MHPSYVKTPRLLPPPCSPLHITVIDRQDRSTSKGTQANQTGLPRRPLRIRRPLPRLLLRRRHLANRLPSLDVWHRDERAAGVVAVSVQSGQVPGGHV